MTDAKDETYLELLYDTYASIAPWERQYSHFEASSTTLLFLRKMTKPPAFPPIFCKQDDEDCWKRLNAPPSLFGIDLRINDSLAFGVVKPVTITPQEARTREFVEEWNRTHPRGSTVVIQSMEPITWPDLPPKPTLKALIRHWDKALARKLKKWRSRK